jgi:hypothetical protein
MVFFQSGCVGTGHVASQATFSPDSQKVAYLWEEGLQEPLVEGKTWLRTIHLRWCPADAPQRMSSVPIRTVGCKYAGYGSVGGDVQWSPDGTRIGILTAEILVIVEVATLAKKEVRDGKITSFAWLSATEIGYSCRRVKGGMQRRVICRYEINAADSNEVAAFDWSRADEYSWHEYWAPSGQYVVFVEPALRGRYHLVSMRTGASHAFGQNGAYSNGAAWAADSSRVLCVSDKVGLPTAYEAILLDPATQTTVDCSSGFMATFAEHRPDLEPVWTADGKYVIVNALEVNGHLVQPDPWKAIPLGKTLAPRFSPPTQWSSIQPRLFRLPVSGWVGVTPTGNSGDSPILFASDYSGHSIKPVLETGLGAVSPDGTKAANIRYKDGQVEIRDLGRWWVAPSDTAPSE